MRTTWLASALDALSHNAGLDKLIRKLNGWGFERILRVELTDSYLRVTPDNFSELHGLLVKACDILDMPEIPGLYIAGGALNAFTAGVEKPLIVLYSGAIEALTNEELLFVIAHELGHIKSAHVLYYQVAKFLPVIGEIVGTATLGLGELFGMGVEVALLRWQRMSEFTADRAGLLGCQDTDLALRTLMKLAGLPAKYFSQINTEDFIAQARDFESMDTDKLTVVAKWLSTMGATHPWTVMRAKQLLEWVDAGGYDEVLRAPRALPFKAPAGVSRFCHQCGFALRGMEGFCPGCGRALAKPALHVLCVLANPTDLPRYDDGAYGRHCRPQRAIRSSLSGWQKLSGWQNQRRTRCGNGWRKASGTSYTLRGTRRHGARLTTRAFRSKRRTDEREV